MWVTCRELCTLTLGRIVVRDLPITVEGDANLAVLCGLELVTVDLDGVCVREDKIVGDDPRLSAAVSLWAAVAVARTARSKHTAAVAENSDAPGLVESEPRQ